MLSMIAFRGFDLDEIQEILGWSDATMYQAVSTLVEMLDETGDS